MKRGHRSHGVLPRAGRESWLDSPPSRSARYLELDIPIEIAHRLDYLKEEALAAQAEAVGGFIDGTGTLA